MTADELNEQAETKRREYDAFLACQNQMRWQEQISKSGIPRLHLEHAGEVDCSGQWRRVYERLSANARGIFALVGPRGSGKTQLAAKLLLARIDMDRVPLYWTVVGVSAQIRSTYRGTSGNGQARVESEESILNAGRYAPLLVIDEIGRGTQSDWADGLLFEIVDSRYRMGAPTLLIGNVEPEQLGSVLGDSILHRMEESGGVIRLAERDYRRERGEV